MSPATKQKISIAQKKRWRESPTLRATIESKLKASQYCSHAYILMSILNLFFGDCLTMRLL